MIMPLRGAGLMAAVRAMESYRPERDRLFEDRFAMGFLPLMYRAIVRLLNIPVLRALIVMRARQVPGAMGILEDPLCRTRFFDDTFRDAVVKRFEQDERVAVSLPSSSHGV